MQGIHKMLDSDEYSWYVLSTIVLGSILLAIATDKEWRESSIIILGLIVVMASFVLLEITPKMVRDLFACLPLPVLPSTFALAAT